MQHLDPVPKEAFTEIIKELESRSLEINKYRNNVGIGRSQCFGIVSRRSLCPDLSRQSWKRVKLHHLLMEYAKTYVNIPFTSIQVNQNMICEEHLDKGNIGLSYIVGFGSYEGGALCVEDYNHNIQYRPLLFDGSKQRHKTKPFRSDRYTIVFHTIHPKPSYRDQMPPLSVYEVVEDNGVQKIRDTRTGAMYWGSHGLDHPLRGRRRDPQTQSSS